MSAAKVIVIEDDRDISRLIAYNLDKEGFSVEQVYDGLEASNRLKDEEFNIVILDIMLPGMDGFDICKELKSSPSHAKTFVIIISAKTSAQNKLYANILGADYYLTKPFNINALIDIVKKLDDMGSRKFLVKGP